MRQTCMRIPHPAIYQPGPRPGWDTTCPICGKRVNEPTQYLRHARGYMFRQGVIPDNGAYFSAVHLRCLEQFRIDPDEWVFSAEGRRQLEAEE